MIKDSRHSQTVKVVSREIFALQKELSYEDLSLTIEIRICEENTYKCIFLA